MFTVSGYKSWIVAIGLMTLPSFAFGQSISHAYINITRSTAVNHYYLNVAADTEFGKAMRSTETDKNGQFWQGFGIRNEVGAELGKFIQFNVGHVSLNMRAKADGSERLFGSRIYAGGRFVFYAPLGNLELGGGATTLRVDYLHDEISSDFFGSGYFYELRYNYFLSQQFSVNMTARKHSEHFTQNGGNDEIKSIDLATTVGSAGFSIWF